MTDYGHELQFGLFPSPNSAAIERTLELVQLAEVEGLDLVSIQDHPYQRDHVDTWTLLSYLGATTSSIRLSPNVANLPLRPPAVLAKAAASLDLLTHGRVELGLGTGAFWDAIVAAGGPRRTPKESVDALIEAIGILRSFWAGGSVKAPGEHYQVVGLQAGPRPAHEIPIWLGAYGPRMLRVTGRLADAWVPSMGYADPPALPDLNATIDEAAVKAGRAPVDIRRIYNIFGTFGTGSGFLRGTPGDWAEQLAELSVDTGISTYILGTDDPDDVRRFASEVAPKVRELVAAERGGRASSAAESSAPQSSAQSSATDSPARESRVATEPIADRRENGVRVTPTADEGVRLTDAMPWNDADRPTSPDATPTGDVYPSEGAATAQHLIDIHNGLREELRQLRDVLGQVREGHATVGQARSVINTLTMRQNNWTLGAYCEAYCRIVTGHHTLEDRSIFPHLRSADSDLVPVIDRLEAEHHDIHGLIDAVDQALVRLVSTDGTGSGGEQALDEMQQRVDVLTDALLSHLAYEERELIGPLARHGFY